MGYIGEDGHRPRSGSSPHASSSSAGQRQGQDAARSPSPSGTASTNNNNSNNGSQRRRDRVSVGSRITKTIVVRPPYAARDELDFERRPRSNTVGTVTSSEANEKAGRAGRHAGIQPPLHANNANAARPISPDAATNRSHLSSLSGTTTTQTPPGPAGAEEKEKEKGEHASRMDNATAGGASLVNINVNTTNGEFNEKTLAPAGGENNGAVAGGGGGGDSSNPLPSQSRPTMSQRQMSNDASRWLAFTLPMKYRKMLDDYMNPRSPSGGSNAAAAGPSSSQQQQRPSSSSRPRRQSSDWRHRDADHADDEDQSDVDSEQSSGDYHYRYFGRRNKKQGQQQQESRQNSGDGGNNDDESEAGGGGGGGRPYFGRSRRSHRNRAGDDNNLRPSQSRRSSRPRGGGEGEGGGGGAAIDAEEGLGMAREPISSASRRNSLQSNTGWTSPWLPHAGADPESGFPGGVGENGHDEDQNSPGGMKRGVKKVKTRAQRFQHWVVRSAFAPLFFRTLNLAFTASLLGVAISIHNISNQYNVSGVLGSSTTFAIIVAPLSLLHIITNVYAEYFGSPIGVWKVRSKMFYTFVELIFICLWSGLLSLAFDDLFTSPAGCTAYTPNAQYRQRPIGASENDGTLAAKLCSRQSALVALVFVGLILYVLVLIVSLFRIFAKISRIQ